MSRPNHRAVAGTKRARQLAAQNSRIPTPKMDFELTPAELETREWNKAIDELRRHKLELKRKI